VLPASTPFWRRPAILAVFTLVIFSAVWIGLRSTSVKKRPVSPPLAKAIEHPSQPRVDPLETQQRQALDTADKRIMANDLDGAMQLLQPAAALNGPLTSEIQKKITQVEESKKDANLRQLRQGEEVLWQRATRLVVDGRFADAQKNLKQILALPAGGVHRDDAQRYLTKTIPQQQAQNGLLAHGRQSLSQGDFPSARRAADQLKQAGGNPEDLVAQIDQAEQSQLRQLENQFDQLKLRDDDSAIQQLKALQPRFQALIDSGPQSGEALHYANNIPAAIADVRARSEKKVADAAFQQIVQRYRQAAAGDDKNGLAAVLGDFHSIAQNGGPHADSAQQYVAEITKKLDALNAPPSPAPTPPSTKEVPVTTVSDEAAIRGVIQRFFQSFEQRNPDALRQVWPNIPQKRYDAYKDAFGNVSAIAIQIGNETVKVSPDGASATVSVQSQEEETPKSEKRPRRFTPSWTFQLSKRNGTWLINDVL
jgi:hypothetical protein